MNPLPYQKNSILFAPLEGITDVPYRQALFKEFPQWDHFFTSFLRIPTTGIYSKEFIIKHFGKKIFDHPAHFKKTTLQILTTPHTQTVDNIHNILELGFKSIDLNLGCPSKKVNNSKGGAYLLSNLHELKQTVALIRKHFPFCFSAKIRVGHHDDSNFLEVLKILEGEGVDAVSIHGRTRAQLYKGRANWSYIAEAASVLKIPIIGNGDIWSISDIKNMFKTTACHSVMLGRGAMKTPWLAASFKGKQAPGLSTISQRQLRKTNIIRYFRALELEYLETFPLEEQLLKRFKAFCRYLFEDFPEGEMIKKKILRSKSLDEFKLLLSQII